MNDFEIIDNKLLFLYEIDKNEDEFNSMLEENDNKMRLRGFFINKDIIFNAEYNKDSSKVKFLIGKINNNFICLDKSVFDLKHEFYFDVKVFSILKIDRHFFFQKVKNFYFNHYINIAKEISECANTNVYIVDEYDENIGNNGYIPYSQYEKLIKNFPNSRELFLYKKMRIETLIGDFFDNNNSCQKYNKYIQKKNVKLRKHTSSYNFDFDIARYEFGVQLLEDNLKNDTCSENEWQLKLEPILRILFPRYIIVLHKVPVIDCEEAIKTPSKRKELDAMLIDVDGNALVVEFKKPFTGDKILTSSYRKNFYLPKFQLSGGIQQIEKYLWNFNQYKKENINLIQKKFANELKEIKIKLIDTHGALICGRSNGQSIDEKNDFEIIRSQYKNIVDILTYDDILTRLKNSIKYLKNYEKKII